MEEMAVIYVRGENELEQELLCLIYATEKGYNVFNVTKDIDEVKDCDVLIATHPSRIARDVLKFYETMRDFEKRGIKVEFSETEENAEMFLNVITRELKELKDSNKKK